MEIVRLRTADDEPVMLETNTFPPAYAWLLEEKLEDVLGLLQKLRDLVGSRELASQGQGWAGPSGVEPTRVRHWL